MTEQQSSRSAFALFLEVASALHHRLGVVAVLYGSLGLSRALRTSEPVGDVDVLVPSELLGRRWLELQATLAELGFALVDLPEHEFRRNSEQIAFAAEELLAPFAGVEPATLRVTTLSDVQFRELSAQDYLAVYGASQHDGYRRDTRGKRDADKLVQIRRFLAAEAGC